MNKQELIKHIEGLPYTEGFFVDTVRIGRSGLLKLINQLDEPQKPVVKQFVADWYEECKDNLEYNIWSYIYNWERKEGSAFKDWIDTGRNKPIQTLVNMHQFGYTVEKEKRYLVKVKGVNDYGCYLNKGLLSKEYFWESKAEIGGCRTKHTRQELKEGGFNWVFDCPGIEIEEVQDDSKI